MPWRSALFLLFFACVTLAFAQGGAAAGPESYPGNAAPVGKVALVEGDVRFYDAHGQLRRPRLGDPVYEGDSIVTGDDGEVHLAMLDGSYIGVRPGTRMRIVEFRAEGDADDRSVIGLLQGAFRVVTGWIAKFNSQNVEIRTPTATIGVRGTDHEPLVIPEGSALGEPGTYDRVYIGETEIRGTQGSVRVVPGRAGFVSRRGMPRLLARVPVFFRPTRNESRFQGLHERIQRQLDRLRTERIQRIEERRRELQRRQGGGKAGFAPGTELRRGGAEQFRQEQRPRLEERQRRIEERRAAAKARREQRLREREELRRERAEEPRGLIGHRRE